jgi:DNA-binding response OmpR family regulator
LRCFDKLNKTVQNYGAMLHKMQCQVRTSSSFAEGAQCLEREQYDLIVLDQGSSRFEGRQVLMTAMEVELARSYNRGCYEEAMQSGALDYVEGRLSEAELVAFLETFVPRRTGSLAPQHTAVKVQYQVRVTRIKHLPVSCILPSVRQ